MLRAWLWVRFIVECIGWFGLIVTAFLTLLVFFSPNSVGEQYEGNDAL